MVWKLSPDSRVSAPAFERQMSNWELGRLQRYERRRRPAVRPEVEDFITISRQPGVPGERVAEALGQLFGWPVFGKKLLDAMAGDDEVRQRIYESMDERDLSWWEEALRGLLESDFKVNDYFHRLTRTVLSLARQSPCVFVGRGCDLILPRHLGLRIRLVFPLEPRVDDLTERRGCTPAQALEEIERVHVARNEYLRHHFGERAADPARADLVINLGRWDADGTLEVVLAAMEKLPGRPAFAARRAARVGGRR